MKTTIAVLLLAAALSQAQTKKAKFSIVIDSEQVIGKHVSAFNDHQLDDSPSERVLYAKLYTYRLHDAKRPGDIAYLACRAGRDDCNDLQPGQTYEVTLIAPEDGRAYRDPIALQEWVIRVKTSDYVGKTYQDSVYALYLPTEKIPAPPK